MLSIKFSPEGSEGEENKPELHPRHRCMNTVTFCVDIKVWMFVFRWRSALDRRGSHLAQRSSRSPV